MSPLRKALPMSVTLPIIQRLILGTIYTIFAFKRAIQISVRLKDVQVLKNLIIPFTLSDFFNYNY